ncbi:unnamed protein product [Symbiodinium pilosum]|uniref:Uncharacterized protein n=1 Tax=Symbiodinium pilosum TaxID=2952 RepID=A0A812R1D7_SYMPI|nr:unnamed protein product [Symbiodinium pilosum]
MASSSEAGAGVAAPLKLWWFWLRHVWGYLACLLETQGQRERESESFPEQKNERARAGAREGGKEREALNDYKTNASKALWLITKSLDAHKDEVAGSFESERQASEVAMRALRDELSKGLSERMAQAQKQEGVLSLDEYKKEASAVMASTSEALTAHRISTERECRKFYKKRFVDVVNGQLRNKAHWNNVKEWLGKLHTSMFRSGIGQITDDAQNYGTQYDPNFDFNAMDDECLHHEAQKQEAAQSLEQYKKGLDKDLAAAKSEHAKALEAQKQEAMHSLEQYKKEASTVMASTSEALTAHRTSTEKQLEAHAKALSEHRDEALKQLEASKEICQKNTAQAQEVLQQNLLSTREGLEKALGEHKEHTAQATELQKKEHSALKQALAKQVAELAKLETKLETKVEATQKEIMGGMEALKKSIDAQQASLLAFEAYKKASAEQMESFKARSAAAAAEVAEVQTKLETKFQKELQALQATLQAELKALQTPKTEG